MNEVEVMVKPRSGKTRPHTVFLLAARGGTARRPQGHGARREEPERLATEVSAAPGSPWPNRFRHGLLVLAIAALGVSADLAAQRAADDPNQVVDPKLFDGLQYRSLNFSRGGRSTAVAGVASDRLVYYFGATGGGVWKTGDAGLTWQNVSDGFFEAGSIGAIAVADADPNVVYVGTGSACPRGNISPGVGMYRSTDAGKTWKHIGLRDAGQIGRIRVHPRDANLVYAAVLGNVFGPSDDRGVFRSRDGGTTWEKVLFISNRTGVVDLAMDATNPRVLYAGAWAVERKPWTIDSGSLDGGVYKSTDGGDTWQRLAGGLPADVLVGKTAVTVSAADPNRVWALVEAADDKGGVYRSDDAGATWRRVNAERRLLQRAWYYIHIYADPQDPDTVYALNTGFYKSTDGGRTFQQYRVPHGDNHDLWINPTDARVMINANDGGANVSFTGATSWTGQMNQPTAEIYRVTVDTRFPYRVYGAQQDNSTISVSSRPAGGGPGGGLPDMYAVGGGESGHIAVDPRNPNLVYAGSYGGTIDRTDTSTRVSVDIRSYPDMQTGQRAADMKYRFQWNAPIRISPHHPDVIYHTSQYVHRTTDAGHSWEVISPDLTRNDKAKQDYSGGKGITRDSTGVEVYGVVFALEESPATPGLLWAGSDDGLVHVSRDGGKSWTNVTPKEMPDFGCVNMIDLSAHDPGRAHIAVYKYRQNDFTPYIFQTSDYGKSWRRLTGGKNGIPATHFVRVVREDPSRKGLLYAGTEFGMYVSFDDGAHWQPFQLNLPATPVTDLLVHQKDLVVSTQGRAFWILDDLSPLHQITDRVTTASNHLFAPREAFRAGAGPATVYYYLAAEPKQPVTIEFSDAKGTKVASYTGRPGAPAEPGAPTGPPPEVAELLGLGGPPRVGLRAGLNRFAWNMRHDSLFEIPRGIVMWGGFGAGSRGPSVVPGTYSVKITAGAWSDTKTLEVKGDPRVKTTQAEYEEQLKVAREVGERIKTLYDTLLELRDIKQQATALGERIQKAGLGDDVAKAARALHDKLTAIEGELTQLEGEGGQDALNFPGRLDNQFVALYGNVVADDKRPTRGAVQRFEDIKPDLARLLARFEQVSETDLAKFNELVRSKNVPPIIVR